MTEPIERIWAKKLEAKLGPVVAKWEAVLHTGSEWSVQTVACFRTALCIAVAVGGFWYPLWCEHRLHDPDSRLGMVTVFSYPAIGVLAFLASASLRRAFKDGSRSSHTVLAIAALSLIALCWFPLLFLTARIIQIFFSP